MQLIRSFKTVTSLSPVGRYTIMKPSESQIQRELIGPPHLPENFLSNQHANRPTQCGGVRFKAFLSSAFSGLTAVESLYQVSKNSPLGGKVGPHRMASRFFYLLCFSSVFTKWQQCSAPVKRFFCQMCSHRCRSLKWTRLKIRFNDATDAAGVVLPDTAFLYTKRARFECATPGARQSYCTNATSTARLESEPSNTLWSWDN